jgi:hypothetical protein
MCVTFRNDFEFFPLKFSIYQELTKSSLHLHRSVDAPRCSTFNHTTAQAAPMSHNLTSASGVDDGGRVLRKRQVDVGSSEFEGFKELFQVFSLTQRQVTPDGNCMSLSVEESTMCQDMSGDKTLKISRVFS